MRAADRQPGDLGVERARVAPDGWETCSKLQDKPAGHACVDGPCRIPTALLPNARQPQIPDYLILLCDADGVRRADLGEAIEDCSTDFELGFLTLEGACVEALAEQLEAVHLGLDQAAAVVAAPLLPDRPAKPLHRAQRFIAGLDAGAAFDPCPAIATNRDDRIGPAPGNGGVTVSGIIGAIAVDAEDRLILGDLRQKRRKGRRITDGVGRDLDCPDIQGLRIDPDMNLAPLAAIGSAVLPCFPFAFAHHLDSGAVDQQVQTA